MRLCRFQPNPALMAEFVAGLWYGDVPPDLILHKWLYVDTDPREMVLLWEGGDEAQRWVEQCFGAFGALTCEVVTDSTAGLAACLIRDLAQFGIWLQPRRNSESEVASELDLRRRGLEARSRDEALAAGRAWAQERPNA
jgi:hypothetical protein